MWKKITSIAALFSSAAALNACQTQAGKPIECVIAPELQRCAKVPDKVKAATRVPRPAALVQRLDEYGQPQ